MATVDTSLAPHASGAAAEYAARHSAEHPLKFYSGWFCPFVQRSWLTLHEKNVPHQYVEVNPYKKEPEFLALNPRGLVPTLEVPAGGEGKAPRPLFESTVICEYINEEFADESQHGPNLLPGDAYQRARCRLWIEHACHKITPFFYKWLQHTPEKPYTLGEVRDDMFKNLKAFVLEMGDSGPWFLGDTFSLVDVMLAPWAMRFFLIDHYKTGGFGLPEEGKGGADEAVWARYRKWFAAIKERQSVKDTWSGDEAYIAAYKRYADDATQSQVAQATRKGERLP
ncbi:putative glutathione S-transferase GSTU6 [Diplonema papillatum]|nr:putative glutathione S-transferase GSTU6 [Diplonema papillatum]